MMPTGKGGSVIVSIDHAEIHGGQKHAGNKKMSLAKSKGCMETCKYQYRRKT
jgi:hypothetical protein